jgi:hypothetical protein
MPGYWWQCEACQETATFAAACNVRSICQFIRDVLLAADFDQELLLRECPSCRRRALRITFEFPRADREVVRVLHVVGRPPQQGAPYLPMIWETFPVSDPEARWFHFNYMNERNPWGLNKAAVFESHDLQAIFDVFSQKTGHSPLSRR